jgi:hypothetical protein
MCNQPHCHAILAQILDELRAIRDELRLKKCNPRDVELLGRLLPAIGGYLGSEPFRVWEALIDPAIEALAGSAARLGGLLQRAAADDLVIDGLQVERLGRIHNATQWRVTRRLVDPRENQALNCLDHKRKGENRK